MQKRLAALLCLLLAASAHAQIKYFKITVVDEQTNRGVPLVELTTTNQITHITDSNGVIAFHEPGMMNQTVFFHIKSHGYEFPKDGFGFVGTRLETKEAASATIKIKRINIAERLYRITGQGIYRDSILLGEKVPVKEPLLNGQVTGQDSVMAAVYRGKLYWFWGDTDRAAYPLGLFATSGATSDLPGSGGLDPSLGVNLTYFTDKTGFSRAMIAIDEPGVKWLTGLMVVRNDNGRENMVARYDRRKGLAERYEHGLLLYNDEKEVFEKVSALKNDAPLYPDALPFKVRVKDEDYYYFPGPYKLPLVRVKATLKDALDPGSYEGFIDNAWKKGAKPKLIHTLIDIETGKDFSKELHLGSVQWNPYRNRWIMIAQRWMDQSYYLEADTPVGPWVYGRRIASYDKYTMYNVAIHPFFNQENGRLIYFEGTYTREFSSAPAATPRYNYNQLMYRLDLADSRVVLPVPVYKVKERYLLRDVIEKEKLWEQIESIPFFACDRQREGLVAIQMNEGSQRFFALPKDSTAPSTFVLGDPPVGRVWTNPQKVLLLDRDARPPTD